MYRHFTRSDFSLCVQIFVSSRLNYDFIADEIDGKFSFLSLQRNAPFSPQLNLN